MQHSEYQRVQLAANIARGAHPHLCPGFGCAVCAAVADAVTRKRLEPPTLRIPTFVTLPRTA